MTGRRPGRLLPGLPVCVAAVAAAAAVLAVHAALPARTPTVEWTMIDVSVGTHQADAHLLRMPDGGYQLIDAGDGGDRLVPFLRTQGVKAVESVFLSHMHKDHYGALPAILGSGLTVRTVYVNVPDRDVCRSEQPWGCDWAHIRQTLASLRARTRVVEMQAGEVLYAKDGVSLRVLCAYDGVNSPVGRTDVNDTSAVLMLEYGRTRVLFTGDLNRALGGHLARSAEDLKADLVKVPHHGTEGVAPNEFFDRVNAATALVPSPRELWLSERSARLRTYFEAKGTRTYVNGLDGHVRVTIDRDGYSVRTQRAR